MIPLLGLALLSGLSTGLFLGSMIERAVGGRNYRADMERMTNLLTIGTSAPSARRLDQAPTAENRAIERVRQGRIANAAAVIMSKYEEKGLTISEEEARLQAEAMLNGKSPLDGVARD